MASRTWRRETLAQILDSYLVAFNGIPRIALVVVVCNEAINCAES